MKKVCGKLLTVLALLLLAACSARTLPEPQTITPPAEIPSSGGEASPAPALPAEENPSQEQIDETDTSMAATKTGEGQVYVSQELGFSVTFPAVWADNYTAMPGPAGYPETQETGSRVEFYYKGDTSAPILSIDAVPVNIWEQVKERLLAEGVKLGENEKNIFVATPFGRDNPFQAGEDKALFDSMYMTKEQVLEKLKLEPLRQ